MLGLEEKVIAVMCIWILIQSVHRINCPCMQYVHSPETQIYSKWLVEMTIPFLLASAHAWYVYILQKQTCYVSKVFGYYNCVTILTMQIL